MKIWKKVCATLVCVSALFAVSLFAVACGENDGNGGGVTQEPADVEVDYTVTVKDEDTDFVVADAELKIWDEAKTEAVATGTTDEKGEAEFKLHEGNYQLQFVSLPDNLEADGEYVTISVSESETATVLYVKDNSPAGSETKPIYLVVGEDSTASITLPASATVYYEVRNLAGAELVVESESVDVLYAGETYTAESGVVTVPVEQSENTWDLKKFAFVNKTDGELTITAKLQTKPGTRENPFAINELTQVTKEINGKEIVYYKWVSTVDGRFVIDGVSENADIILINLETSTETEKRGATPIDTLSIEVGVGDEVLIVVCAYGATDIGTYNIVFTASAQEAANA